MPRYTTEAIRNLALVGQSGSGKTTLVEALLAQAGAIGAPGSVERGNTVSDFDPLEQGFQHSLNASVVSFDHQDIHVNLVDTPGLPDFIGLALGAFPAVETVAVVVNAAAGIEPVARRMLDWSGERKLCRMVIVNKIDAEGVDLPGVLQSLREEFGRELLPINLPAENAATVRDCFFHSDGGTDFSSVQEAHTELIDQVVEVDEALMSLYLEQGENLAPQQLHDAFEKAMREGHLVPVCFVSARTGAGVGELLDVMERLMPNPLEGNPRPFIKGTGDKAEAYAVKPDPKRHVVAHVFKVTADPFVGKLGVFRIHQGTVTRDSQLFIGDGRKPFKVGHLFKLLGKQQIEMDEGIPGDICAVAKVEEIHFDAVLHDSHDEDFLHLKPLPFPVPVFGLAIAAKRRGDEQRLSNALQRVVEEDPCLVLEHNAELNETVLRGLGDLHLRLALEKLNKRFNVDAETRPPKIPYRETISGRAEGHHRHKKQTGGAGQFGEVFLRVEPLERGAGFEFADEVKGGAIPGQFIPAVEKGVRQAMETGALAGYPMHDVKVTVTDGKYHPVDSKEVAFVTAGRRAFLDAVSKAGPMVLEPIVNLELVVPAGAMGTITGDLTGRRGHVLGSRTLPGGMIGIRAQAPLAELNHYADRVRSLTGGQGSYTLEFSHYQPAPPALQKQLAAEFRPKAEED
ncbi:MAG: elongation factor G [Thiohalomonadaceae bacterium]